MSSPFFRLWRVKIQAAAGRPDAYFYRQESDPVPIIRSRKTFCTRPGLCPVDFKTYIYTMKKLFFIALTAILFTGSCNIIDQQRIKGNGKTISKTYDLKNFSSIDVGNASSVFLKQDSVFSVKVEADENLFEYIQAGVEEGELDIDEKDGYNLNPSNDIKIYISMPLVKKASLSGASTLKGENKIIQEELEFDSWVAQSRFELLDEVTQPSIDKAYNEAINDFRKYKKHLTPALKEKALRVFKKVAEACSGLSDQEKFIIDRFKHDLQEM